MGMAAMTRFTSFFGSGMRTDFGECSSLCM